MKKWREMPLIESIKWLNNIEQNLRSVLGKKIISKWNAILKRSEKYNRISQIVKEVNKNWSKFKYDPIVDNVEQSFLVYKLILNNKYHQLFTNIYRKNVSNLLQYNNNIQ